MIRQKSLIFQVLGSLAFGLLGATCHIPSAWAVPVTTHPRLWVTQADLPRLRSWASSSNPMYAKALQPTAAAGLQHANACWNWTTGKPLSCWHDTGSTNWETDDTEAYAEMFAFMSLVDPSAQNRQT